MILTFDSQIKRDNDFTVKQISNGFLFEFSGRDENDDWINNSFFVTDEEKLNIAFQEWLALEKQK